MNDTLLQARVSYTVENEDHELSGPLVLRNPMSGVSSALCCACTLTVMVIPVIYLTSTIKMSEIVHPLADVRSYSTYHQSWLLFRVELDHTTKTIVQRQVKLKFSACIWIA